MAQLPGGPTTPHSARRFVRYSLRSMLVVMTLVCVASWYWFRVPFERQAERPMTDHEINLVGQGEPIASPFGPLPMPLVARERLQYRRVPFAAPIRHGTTIVYHPGLDVILGEEHWQDGQLHGPWLRFHRNGTVAERGEYRSGKKTGRWEYFDVQGAELCYLSFDAGILHGPAEWKPWPGHEETSIIYEFGEIKSINLQNVDDSLGEGLRTGAIQDRALEAALASIFPVEFFQTSLRDVCTYYSQVLLISATLDVRSLEERALDVDTPITFCSAPHMPAGTGFRLAIAPLDLVPVYRYEQIWITHRLDAAQWIDRSGIAALVASPPAEVPAETLAVVQHALSEQMKVEFKDMPISQVCRHFRDVHRLPITFDRPYWLDKEPPIFLEAKDLSVSAALFAICEHLAARVRWQPDHTLAIELRDE